MTAIVMTVLERNLDDVETALSSRPPSVEIVELRLDGFEDPTPLIEKIPEITVDVIATCRSSAQGGWAQDQSRLQWLERAAAAGASWIDLESRDARPDIADSCRVIRSWHDFEGVADDLEYRAAELGEDADVVKVACLASSLDGLTRMLELPRHHPTLSVVSIAMGTWGSCSRLAAGAFGMPFTYASSPAGRSAAPGQIPADIMVDPYRADRIADPWPFFLVLGHDPESEALAALNRAVARRGLDMTFLPFPEIELDDVDDFAGVMTIAGVMANAPGPGGEIRVSLIDDLLEETGVPLYLVR